MCELYTSIQPGFMKNKHFGDLLISDCPVLRPGEGALASSRETAFGTSVTFTCPVGQEFATGKTRITTQCLPGGNWSVSYIPRCQGNVSRSPLLFFLTDFKNGRSY